MNRSVFSPHVLGSRAGVYKALAFAAVCALALGVAPSSQADTEYSLAYSYDDFKTQDAVKQLHQRIVKTARQHCPSYFTTRSLPDVTRCVNEVVEDLVGIIDNQKLTDYARGEDGLRVAAEAVKGDDPA